MWSKEISIEDLIKVFPKATPHYCCASDTVLSVYKNYGIRVVFNRNTFLYSYQQ